MTSLRRDVHSAFEQIAPPLGGMPERVVQTVLAENKARRRKERMLVRMRMPLSLVAVLLLIAMVAAVLIGGRLVQDWNAFHKPSPVGQAPLSELAQLEARPLHIPIVRSNCNDGPHNAQGSYGSGPVYADGGGQTVTSWGSYFRNSAYSDVPVDGPILVRARDLYKAGTVIFVADYAAGPVVGTDVVNGQALAQHTELVLYTTQPVPGSGRYFWQFTAGEPKSASGSTGWQIDGLGFSEVFVAC